MIGNVIAIGLLLVCASGTWCLSRRLHPGLLGLVGLTLYGIGFTISSSPRAGTFFLLLQVLGTVVVVHSIVLWVKKTRQTAP